MKKPSEIGTPELTKRYADVTPGENLDFIKHIVSIKINKKAKKHGIQKPSKRNQRKTQS